MKKLKLGLLSLLFTLSTISAPLKQVQAAAQTPIARSQAEQRAMSIINLTWTYSKDRNSKLDPALLSKVTQPSQFNGVNSGTMTGIPYDWGGLDSLETSSYNEPWTNFLDAVNKGAYLGNINSSGGIGHVTGTAGLDCSGFVQAVFNIKGTKLSTSTLFNQYFVPIDINNIRHMDILNYPGHHVVIFDRWGTKNGVSGAYTYEATTNQAYGGIQGTKRYFISSKAITSYTPGRYVNIIEDGTPIQPPPKVSSKPDSVTVTKKSSVAQQVQENIQNQTSASQDRADAQTSDTVGSLVQSDSRIEDGTIIGLRSTSSGLSPVNYSSDGVTPVSEKGSSLA